MQWLPMVFDQAGEVSVEKPVQEDVAVDPDRRGAVGQLRHPVHPYYSKEYIFHSM